MSSSQAKWDCSQCGCAPNDRRKYCTECHSMLTWTCTSSGKSEQRKAYYHAKSSTNYALKVQIAYDFHYRIVHVSECFRGSVDDITVLRESGLLEHVNNAVQIIADKGYIGEEYVITPKKKPHARELIDEDKDLNHDINSTRVAIENINQRLKIDVILGGIYRGTIDDFHKATKIEQVVCILCNLNLIKHPIRR
ncbi:unnamed protein product [Rotaria sp. Silwood2]|nr:unnamed protein product [Rotaria sp. Silwood2]CAF4072448.1 unnamed protein product [Rotaria sp. Silwood2]CAF4361833.1 unnamed protein product [Rotaria sp. Silwood2]